MVEQGFHVGLNLGKNIVDADVNQAVSDGLNFVRVIDLDIGTTRIGLKNPTSHISPFHRCLHLLNHLNADNFDQFLGKAHGKVMVDLGDHRL